MNLVVLNDLKLEEILSLELQFKILAKQEGDEMVAKVERESDNGW